jgi:hypothetical protein
MADRFPLIANPQTKLIEELAANDNLNLTNNGIVGASTISAERFVGNLTGTATTAFVLTDASNILTGTISSSRLNGFYNIEVTTSSFLTNAQNILSGTIPRNRLGGSYDINVTGIAETANSLTDASRILGGTLPQDRLTGVYNIDITGTAFSAVGAAASISLYPSGDSPGTHYIPFSDVSTGEVSLYSDSQSLTYIPSSNRLGIGTNLPSTNLDVRGSANISGTTVINVGFASTAYISNLFNVTGIDTTTRLTLEQSLGINNLSYLSVVGFTTLSNYTSNGQATLNNLNATGVSTFNQVVFSSSSGSINAPRVDTTYLNVSGISTFSTISIGSTVVITPTRVLSNIAGIDSATKSTFTELLRIDFFDNIATNGIGTIDGKVRINNGLEVLNQTTLDDLNITGVTTIGNVGITTNSITSPLIEGTNVNISGVSTALRYFGDGSSLSGIVTTVVAGIGISLSPGNGKGQVTVSAFRPVGKTIFVSQSGNDLNSGLAENDTKRTIKAAAAIAMPGDTIKVFPGIYVENNPVILGRGVAVEGAELRNCIVSPQNPGLDLFHVNNSVHITDLSFQGQESQNGAAVVAFQPLSGVASDRFFDAARMIRLNLDYIAKETVGYLTSTDYKGGSFSMGIGTAQNCAEDIKSIFKAVCHDITRGGNSKCVGAGKSYYTEVGALQHIVGVKTETIDAIRYAAGIARSCINNVSWNGNYQNQFFQVKDLSMQPDGAYGNQSLDGCANVVSAIYSCVGVVTTIINQGLSVLGAGINTTFPGNAGAGTTIPNHPSFSPGVGPITQGPYVRNCTNFIPKSIGMKVDGFTAEPGDQDDIGVTGSMSVDSYTQYNQGGIGVSVTNGAYAQLVSIFTICDEIAIYTASGGQLDLTNSNSSFGTYGLVAEGVGGSETKSIYRYTGVAVTNASRGQNQIVVSGVGSNRPYDGQAIYFDTLYKTVDTISVTNGGSGYTIAPRVTVDFPSGPNGISAQATATVENGSVTAINVITSGTQYTGTPSVTISPPIGAGTTATAVVTKMQPIYYTVLEATLPSAGVSTISLAQNLNNTVSAGSTAYFSRLSLQLTSSHAFEFIGAGNTIEGARPAQGGITIQENEVVQNDGGLVVYTSTDQAGNFRIGDGVVINQTTGSITGRDFTKALFTTITPFILALTE